MQNYLIIADGNFLVKEIITEAAQDKIIVALDGAANKLHKLNIQPNVILGDFDAIDTDTCAYYGVQKCFAELTDTDQPYIGKHDVTIVPTKDQQATDLTKGIRYCDQQGAKSITIICATGGRLDHHESILRALRVEYKKQRPIYLHTEQQTVRFAQDEELTINGKVGDYCGIMAFPHAFFTSQGLCYEGDHYELRFGFAESSCNALNSSEAKIKIESEALIIMPAQLASQHAFMRKSELERKELELRDLRG